MLLSFLFLLKSFEKCMYSVSVLDLSNNTIAWYKRLRPDFVKLKLLFHISKTKIVWPHFIHH